MIEIPEKDPRVIAFREAEEKLCELRRQRTAKWRESEDLRARLSEEAGRQRVEQLNREADCLLAGDDIAEDLPPDLQQSLHELDVFDVAIKKQEAIVDAARGKFSRSVQEQNHARYVQIEKRISKAVKDLAEANQAEAEFFSELRDAGCRSISFRPMAVNAIGLASDSQSGAAFFHAELKRFIPEAAL